MSNNALRLLVFDLDGTLIDSRRDIADAANALLVEHGAPALPEERIGRMVGEGAAMLVARAFEAAGRPLPADALAGFIRLYDERLVAHTRPYPGIPALLDAVARQSTLAVLTNKPLAATQSILDALDLARFFGRDLVLGGDGPLARKPDPAGLAHLMASTGTPPDATLLVGDSIIDWRTATAARTRICLARYGFGFETFPLEQLRGDEWGIDAPGDLLKRL